MTLSDLAKYLMTRSARGLSATAEILVELTIDKCHWAKTQCQRIPQRRHVELMANPKTRKSVSKNGARSACPIAVSVPQWRVPRYRLMPRSCLGMKTVLAPPLHIGILHLVSISTYHCSRHVILYQSAKFYPNRTTLGRKKLRHVDFPDGGSKPSWILRIQ